VHGVGGETTGFAARCLLRAARWATLSTTADGQAFASLVTHAVTGEGAVLLLLSSLADHSRHLAAEPRCAVLVVGETRDPNPQAAPRLCVTGVAERQDDPALRGLWLRRHPYARLYADFTDFALWRIKPVTGLFVAGFARADRLWAAELGTPPQLAAALADAEDGILRECNARHRRALDALAQAQGEQGHWRMIGLDSDGFDLAQDETVRRIAFDSPVRDVAGVRAAMARGLVAARARR
jgi:putative heme iron utilization protein